MRTRPWAMLLMMLAGWINSPILVETVQKTASEKNLSSLS